MYKILVVEDEKALNDLITMNLEVAGYGYDKVYNGIDAMEMINKNKYNLLLLDVMLPGVSGFELAEKIKHLNIPIIFITALDTLGNKVKGFNLGAEDYIVKPFEILELLARINVVLRNRYGYENISIGDIVINTKERRVYKDNKEIFLTRTEYELFETLAVNRNIALSREKLLELVWGYDYEGETRVVDVYIQKIRKKLSVEKKLVTVYKYGYRLEV